MGIALDAAAMLAKTGVQARVIDRQTAQPLDEDEDANANAATRTGRIVVAEEHLMAGRPGSADAADVTRRKTVPMEFVNVGDTDAESGEPDGRFAKESRVIFATKMPQFPICEPLWIDHAIEYERNPVSLMPGFLLERSLLRTKPAVVSDLQNIVIDLNHVESC